MFKKKNLSFFFSFILCFLVGCGDHRADFEEANFLIGKGNSSDAQSAISIVEPYLSSTSIETRMEASRLYAGAKMVQAGLEPPRFFSRLLERDDDQGTVQSFKTALANIKEDEAKNSRKKLFEAFENFLELYSSEDFQNIDSSSDEELVRQKRGVYFSDARILLLYALIIGAVDSNLLEADADPENSDFLNNCEAALGSGDDDQFKKEDGSSRSLFESFVWTLRLARIRMISAGLEDNQQKAEVLERADIDLGPFAGNTADPKNNEINNLIQKLQENIDTDYDGDPGPGSGVSEENYTVDNLCEFLNNNERGSL